MYFPYIYKIGPRQEALSLGPQKAYYAILKPYLPDLLLTQLMKYASESTNTTNRTESPDVRLNMLHVIPRLSMYYLLTSLFTTIFKSISCLLTLYTVPKSIFTDTLNPCCQHAFDRRFSSVREFAYILDFDVDGSNL